MPTLGIWDTTPPTNLLTSHPQQISPAMLPLPSRRAVSRSASGRLRRTPSSPSQGAEYSKASLRHQPRSSLVWAHQPPALSSRSEASPTSPPPLPLSTEPAASISQPDALASTGRVLAVVALAPLPPSLQPIPSPAER